MSTFSPPIHTSSSCGLSAFTPSKPADLGSPHPAWLPSCIWLCWHFLGFFCFVFVFSISFPQFSDTAYTWFSFHVFDLSFLSPSCSFTLISAKLWYFPRWCPWLFSSHSTHLPWTISSKWFPNLDLKTWLLPWVLSLPISTWIYNGHFRAAYSKWTPSSLSLAQCALTYIIFYLRGRILPITQKSKFREE